MFQSGLKCWTDSIMSGLTPLTLAENGNICQHVETELGSKVQRQETQSCSSASFRPTAFQSANTTSKRTQTPSASSISSSCDLSIRPVGEVWVLPCLHPPALSTSCSASCPAEQRGLTKISLKSSTRTPKHLKLMTEQQQRATY